MTSKKTLLAVMAAGIASMAIALSADAQTQPKPAKAPAPKAAPKVAPAAAPAAARARAVSLPAMSAAQVVERNVAARGGLAAWRAVQTVSWKGKMGAGATTYAVVTPQGKLEQKEHEETLLPFRFEFKRPLKSRLELDFNGQTAVQVFNGTSGWKLRPYLGRNDWEAYLPDEQKQAAADPGIDGLLIDYAAKGARVESDGTEMVDNHAAYRLKVTRKDGEVRHVWVDGESFLDVRIDGNPRKLDGRPHPVVVDLRDYKRDQGLMIPHLLETAVQGVPRTEKITIDSITVNPKLDDSRFTKPK
jgi:outer membrane lipoprotein-sorting protein